MRPERIPYGVKDFKRVRLEDFCYADKTQFIERLEARANFLFFVRPRRFGKSMLCEMLRCYSEVAEKENFEKLFGGLYAGAHPTKNANRYFVPVLDFSRVGVFCGATWAGRFGAYMDSQLNSFMSEHHALFASDERVMSCYTKPGAEAKYDDASFCLVSDALLTGKGTAFDFTLDGVRHSGTHAGVYLWRNGKVAYATPGWNIRRNDNPKGKQDET